MVQKARRQQKHDYVYVKQLVDGNPQASLARVKFPKTQPTLLLPQHHTVTNVKQRYKVKAGVSGIS